MLLNQFDPPASTADFDSISNQRQAWSDTLAFWFTREVKSVEQLIGVGNSQFYDPHTTDTPAQSPTRAIVWTGFPQLIANRHPGNHRAALQEAEQLLSDSGGFFRPQDEYCEWFVARDPATQKI